MNRPQHRPNIEDDGWTLISAEERHASHPESFEIPSRTDRESLVPGDGAKLLFDIETRDDGRIVDRGVDRMWVIVKASYNEGYLGVLDSDPGAAENLRLRQGDTVDFGPEHVAELGNPPRDYVVARYGASFFEP